MGSNAVVLLSGGLDSTTTLAIALARGHRVYGLSFDYGQRHRAELEAARRVAERFGIVDHRVLRMDLRAIGGSALTADVEVPKARAVAEMAREIPVTYVPARNTIFLSYALAHAEVVGADRIFIGVNAVDYSGYPDCRPEYIEAYQNMANLATRAGVEGRTRLRIETPLLNWTKAEIIRQGLALGVDYGDTVSCYDPSPLGEGCSLCDACQLRLQGFLANGTEDPAPYVRVAA
ncbi:MAG TPA: 7-cyano-7-deazaguanine synthase QueC [Longimicrobium sp.]